MVNNTAFGTKKFVSYIQLSEILESVEYQHFNGINIRYIQTEQSERLWLTVDGKELRGTNDSGRADAGGSGQKRGENLVIEDFGSQMAGFYLVYKDIN